MVALETVNEREIIPFTFIIVSKQKKSGREENFEEDFVEMYHLSA